MKTYVLIVSRYFPTTHKRKGEETFFPEKIIKATNRVKDYAKVIAASYTDMSNTYESKLHTCRANYELWQKRIKEVRNGEAILSIRYWSGKPYNSKQVIVCNLTKDDGVGVQRLEFQHDKDRVFGLYYPIINTVYYAGIKELATNDGLSYEDFKEWFRTYDLTKPMAIIHFTSFRY